MTDPRHFPQRLLYSIPDGETRVIDATTGRTVLRAGTEFAARLAPHSTAIWFLHDT
ncbi:MAG: hypothetical protein WDA75_06935 [Candidatus Latescibacterota bacterium]|jgi:hypothetical protein